MKKEILFLLFILPAILFSQDLTEIKNSENYIYGKGEAPTHQKANKLALDDLISQISVRVESKFENMVVEEQEDGEFNLKEYTKSVVNTYSNIQLNNAGTKVIEGKKKITVYRFIKKTDLAKMFEDRKKKITNFVECGLVAEKDLRIGDALRYYYWSLILLRSHPEYSSFTYKIGNNPEMLLSTTLYDKINHVLQDLDFEVYSVELDDEEDQKTITIKITYNGKPIENLDYIFFTGNQYSSLNSAKDGYGVVELFGSSSTSLDRIRLFIEYDYENKSSWDGELLKVMQTTTPPPAFRKSERKLRLPEDEEEIVEVVPEKIMDNIVYETQQKQIFAVKEYKNIIEEVVSATQAKNPYAIRNHFTDEGFEIFMQLIGSGNVKILGTRDTLNIIEVNGEVMLRSVPMLFSYHNNSRKFMEDVVFVFDKNNKINSISFALGDKAIADIVNIPQRWGTIEDKYQIIRFMEDYKTAYCLKRLDYIESIFADNALIIVGRVIKEDENKPLDGMYMSLGENKVKYIRHTKESYIKGLRNVFESNEYVNIHFEDNTVKRVNNVTDKTYGIQINQHYYSSYYADKGYLFLMIDLNDSLNPKIYVRTWQPEKNVDGSVFGLQDFHF